jgi:hypothetical protein
MTFPNEVPFDQTELIREAGAGVFDEFDDALSGAAYFYDFVFTWIAPQEHIIARPKPGINQKIWGYNQLVNEWFEDIMVDAQGVSGPCASCDGPSSHLPNCAGWQQGRRMRGFMLGVRYEPNNFRRLRRSGPNYPVVFNGLSVEDNRKQPHSSLSSTRDMTSSNVFGKLSCSEYATR